MTTETWGQIIIPVVGGVCGYLFYQVRVLHGRISRRDERLRDLNSRLVRVETIIERDER